MHASDDRVYDAQGHPKVGSEPRVCTRRSRAALMALAVGSSRGLLTPGWPQANLSGTSGQRAGEGLGGREGGRLAPGVAPATVPSGRG